MALLGLAVMNPSVSSRSSHYYDPHFKEEETEARGSEFVVNTVGALGNLSSWF